MLNSDEDQFSWFHTLWSEIRTIPKAMSGIFTMDQTSFHMMWLKECSGLLHDWTQCINSCLLQLQMTSISNSMYDTFNTWEIFILSFLIPALLFFSVKSFWWVACSLGIYGLEDVQRKPGLSVTALRDVLYEVTWHQKQKLLFLLRLLKNWKESFLLPAFPVLRLCPSCPQPAFQDRRMSDTPHAGSTRPCYRLPVPTSWTNFSLPASQLDILTNIQWLRIFLRLLFLSSYLPL